jgi:NAD(P)-dependent dehydrogenase (short-subunit alcohol dehydrogenase family)
MLVSEETTMANERATGDGSVVTRGGKVAIVTGANGGIGLETARGLAARGFAVVLACRDLEKAEAARASIAQSHPGAEVVPMKLDLGSMQSIRAFVDTFEARFDRLHVLVNNAALVPSKRALTADGLEVQFGVNHLGPFLLTRLLVPVLERSAPSRVVVLSSSVYKGAKIDFEDLQAERSYATMTVYGASKLMNLLFVRSLAKRLAGRGVMANAVHPGVVSTALARDFPAPFRVMAKLFFSTPEKGARTSLFVATDPSLEGVSGRYFASAREAKIERAGLDDAAAERLWQVSSKIAMLPAWPLGGAPLEVSPTAGAH